MAFLKWIFALPFLIAAVAFAVANPNNIQLIWSPLHDPVDLPVYALILGFLGMGFILGAFMAWLSMSRTRQERRQFKRENKRLEKELNKREKEQADLSKDPMLKQIQKDKEALKTLIP